MRYFLIMNPGSRGGKSQKRFNRIFALLEQSGVCYDYRITAAPEDAYLFSRQANLEGYDVIVAVGGDGTINRCLNGFFAENGRRISRAKFAVVYTGTSPDFCKSYHIPLALEQAVQVLLTGESRRIGIGKITHPRRFDPCLNGRSIEECSEGLEVNYFGCCANLGIGASIARNANSGIRKYLGDYPGTFLAMLKSLYHYHAGDFTVKIDGETQRLTKVFNISVGRTTHIASGIKIKNNLEPEERRFYLLLTRKMRFGKWLEVFKKIYSGRDFVNNEVLALHYAEKVEVYGNSSNPEIEFDGDPGGFLPCRIELAEEPLDLICRAGDGAAYG